MKSRSCGVIFLLHLVFVPPYLSFSVQKFILEKFRIYLRFRWNFFRMPELVHLVLIRPRVQISAGNSISENLKISPRFCHDFIIHSQSVRNTSIQSRRRGCIMLIPYAPHLTRSRGHIDNTIAL